MKKRRYENLDNKATVATFKELRQWRKERKGNVKDLSFIMPSVLKTEKVFIQTNRSVPTITWIGHSTFLIQLDGLNILTDPVWANRLGFDRRLSPPGLPIGDMPNIDYVLISHGHYDHLHYSSIKKLKGDPTYLVPVGLGKWFKRKNFHKAIEFNWWEDLTVNGVTFTFVPAQHWTRRSFTDTNTSHWGGWIINSSNHTIYFAGDSGYFKGFSEIGRKFEIDYCLMPIGAYEPEWFMAIQHVCPEEAVRAFLDSQSKVMIPMHYGAFRLADDTADEALGRLHTEWSSRGLDKQKLHVMELGETLKL